MTSPIVCLSERGKCHSYSLVYFGIQGMQRETERDSDREVERDRKRERQSRKRRKTRKSTLERVVKVTARVCVIKVLKRTMSPD